MVAQETIGSAAKGRTSQSWFFSGMSVVMLLIVLAGFARSFFLRSFLGYTDLPIHLFIHGTVLTAWFILAFSQSCLVSIHRVDIHRRLGIAGMAVAVGVVTTGVWTVMRRDAPVIDEAPRAAFGNLSTLIAFSLCVGLGCWFRRRPAVHKRLMLMASISIIGPAADRASLLPPLDSLFASSLAGISMPPQIVVALVVTLSLLLALPIHDFASRKRLHGATIGGILCMLVFAPALSAALTITDIWIAFVRQVA